MGYIARCDNSEVSIQAYRILDGIYVILYRYILGILDFEGKLLYIFFVSEVYPIFPWRAGYEQNRMKTLASLLSVVSKA